MDRDGVINYERGDYTYRKADFQLIEGVTDMVRRFYEAGFALVVVSNQSGIAKGLYGHQEVAVLHDILKREVEEKGGRIEEIFYCPHHPEVGHCLCRKPGSLMVERALAKFALDPEKTWLVGDNQRDIEAAEKAGIKGVRIASNSPLSQVEWLLKEIPRE